MKISTVDGDRGKNYPKKTDYHSEGYSLFLGADNIADGKLNLYKCIFLTKEKHESMGKGIAREDDILLVMRGNGTGRSCIYRGEIKSFQARINSGLVIIRHNKEFTNIEFLHQLFQSPVIQKQFEGYMFGSAQPQLTIQLLKSLRFCIPKLEEQEKIAQILSTWDQAISTTEKLLENSQQQKKALMQQLLAGEKRLLDENGERFSGDWNSATLGEIGEIKSAGVDKKIVDGEIPIRLLNFTDVFKRNFIYSDELNHWVTAPISKVESCDVRKGDVFFTPSSETRDETGIPAVAAEDIPNCCYSYHIVRFRISEQWDLNFKAYAFTASNFRKQIDRLADGSGQRYVVSQDNFRSIIVHYPNFEEQVAIGKVLKSAEDEIHFLQRELDCLKQEKKALMQQLLTGKRRVKV